MWKEVPFDEWMQATIAFVLPNSEEYSSYVSQVGAAPTVVCYVVASRHLQCHAIQLPISTYSAKMVKERNVSS